MPAGREKPELDANSLATGSGRFVERVTVVPEVGLEPTRA